jgi:hypothetical protein
LDFLTIWWKAPFWLVKNKKKKKKKKDEYLGNPAQGQADPARICSCVHHGLA